MLALSSVSVGASVLAVAVFVITIAIEPAIGLVAVAIAIPFGNLVRIPLGGANLVDVLVGVTAAAWIARGVAQRRLVFRAPPLTSVVLILTWTLALSLTQAQSFSLGAGEWLKWLEFALVYLLATQLLAPHKVAWVIGALFASAMAEVALGAYQYLNSAGPEAFLVGEHLRAYGTLNQPNPYAGYLGCLTPVAVSLALAALGRWWTARKRIDLALGTMCAVIGLAMIAGIAMSSSRGSWLGLAAGLLVVVCMRSRRTAIVSSAVIVLLVVFLAAAGTAWLPHPLASRVSDLAGYITGPDPARTEITDANFAILERLAHWESGLRMFDAHPLLGVGIGNYEAAYGSFALPHWYDSLGHAHNIFINFLAESGFVGLAAFLLFWCGALVVAWRGAQRSSGYSAAVALGVVGTIAYITVHSLFDNLFVQHIQLQLALMLGGVASAELASE